MFIILCTEICIYRGRHVSMVNIVNKRFLCLKAFNCIAPFKWNKMYTYIMDCFVSSEMPFTYFYFAIFILFVEILYIYNKLSQHKLWYLLKICEMTLLMINHIFMLFNLFMMSDCLSVQIFYYCRLNEYLTHTDFWQKLSRVFCLYSRILFIFDRPRNLAEIVKGPLSN